MPKKGSKAWEEEDTARNLWNVSGVPATASLKDVQRHLHCCTEVLIVERLLGFGRVIVESPQKERPVVSKQWKGFGVRLAPYQRMAPEMYARSESKDVLVHFVRREPPSLREAVACVAALPDFPVQQVKCVQLPSKGFRARKCPENLHCFYVTMTSLEEARRCVSPPDPLVPLWDGVRVPEMNGAVLHVLQLSRPLQRAASRPACFDVPEAVRAGRLSLLEAFEGKRDPALTFTAPAAEGAPRGNGPFLRVPSPENLQLRSGKKAGKKQQRRLKRQQRVAAQEEEEPAAGFWCDEGNERDGSDGVAGRAPQHMCWEDESPLERGAALHKGYRHHHHHHRHQHRHPAAGSADVESPAVSPVVAAAAPGGGPAAHEASHLSLNADWAGSDLAADATSSAEPSRPGRSCFEGPRFEPNPPSFFEFVAPPPPLRQQQQQRTLLHREETLNLHECSLRSGVPVHLLAMLDIRLVERAMRLGATDLLHEALALLAHNEHFAQRLDAVDPSLVDVFFTALEQLWRPDAAPAPAPAPQGMFGPSDTASATAGGFSFAFSDGPPVRVGEEELEGHRGGGLGLPSLIDPSEVGTAGHGDGDDSDEDGDDCCTYAATGCGLPASDAQLHHSSEAGLSLETTSQGDPDAEMQAVLDVADLFPGGLAAVVGTAEGRGDGRAQSMTDASSVEGPSNRAAATLFARSWPAPVFSAPSEAAQTGI